MEGELTFGYGGGYIIVRFSFCNRTFFVVSIYFFFVAIRPWLRFVY